MFQIPLGLSIILSLNILLKTITKLPFGTITLSHSIMYNVHSCMYHACIHESMMLIIVTTPCHDMICHVIVMGDLIIISCKGPWYFQITNFISQMYINTIFF